MKHTPGNWRLITAEEYREIYEWDIEDCPVDEGGYAIVAEDGDTDPWVVAIVSMGQPGEDGADAKLLAAAPNLVKALAQLLEAIEDFEYDVNRQFWSGGKDNARTALLKAGFFAEE